MRLENFNNIYFIGIGGIGMSALARYFNVIGKKVAGYDKVETILTKQLVSEGIQVSYVDSADTIDVEFRNNNTTVVIVTPAIPADNSQLKWFKKADYKLFKRAEVLGYISRTLDSVCIAGTHGKTSISTMTSYLLNESLGCNAFLGGISVNYKSNLVLHAKSPLVVIEADEYDRSFLHLRPDAALITAIDADHLDIYHSRENIEKAFQDFICLIKHEGTLIIHKDLEGSGKLPLTRSYYTYGFESESADFYAQNVRSIDGLYCFDFVCPRHKIRDIKMGIPGKLNAENMLGAMALACLKGVSDDVLRRLVSEYKGVVRRFQIHYQTENCIYIDDYAHHPEEIRKTLESVKAIWPTKKITVVFQPHLFSRTKDFHLEFAQALDLADDVFLLDIYPARELPIEGVTSNIILNEIKRANATIVAKTNLIETLKSSAPEVLLTMGAGDIDLFVNKIKEEVFNG